jgi:hypothetical protein
MGLALKKPQACLAWAYHKAKQARGEYKPERRETIADGCRDAEVADEGDETCRNVSIEGEATGHQGRMSDLRT